MAASTKPTSRWVSSYSDKSDQWVQARIEYLEGLERISGTGSIPRRKEIRTLRVELLDRKKKAQVATEEAEAAAAALPDNEATSPAGTVPEPQLSSPLR